ncbi:MAG: hypothetical protein HKN91_14710, partial [Acidimicrobiia bacterium]|nr:hypothetical protein [Acidimicrobiia bacterium]
DYLQIDGSFGPSPAEIVATLGSPGATATTWQLDVMLAADSYDLELYVRDDAGNEGTAANADFGVTDGPDEQPPSANVDHAKNTQFTGPDITLTGVAADNVGVSSVELKVKDRDSGLWLQSDGSFAAGVEWLPVSVANPGAADVGWSIDLNLVDGRYNPVARAFDAAGNEGTQTDFRPFEVVGGGGGGDIEAPTANVDHAKNTQFTGPNITITGVANDNVGVVTVQVKVKDRDTGEWLQADGSFAASVHWHDVAVDNPGAMSATWSITLNLTNGRYNPVTRAYDAAGNEGTQTAFRPFEVI